MSGPKQEDDEEEGEEGEEEEEEAGDLFIVSLFLSPKPNNVKSINSRLRDWLWQYIMRRGFLFSFSKSHCLFLW